MDYPKFIVSNQKEESISIQKVNLDLCSCEGSGKTALLVFLPLKFAFTLSNSTDSDKMPQVSHWHILCFIYFLFMVSHQDSVLFRKTCLTYYCLSKLTRDI